MLTFHPNRNKDAIHFIFRDFYTERRLFETAFDLDESLKIAQGLIEEVENLKKGNNMDKQIKNVKKSMDKKMDKLVKEDVKRDAKCDMAMKKKKGK